jgi:hypothetical protein
MTTAASTFMDYIQETYRELELHLIPALQKVLSFQYVRTPFSENCQSSFCPLSAMNIFQWRSM